MVDRVNALLVGLSKLDFVPSAGDLLSVDFCMVEAPLPVRMPLTTSTFSFSIVRLFCSLLTNDSVAFCAPSRTGWVVRLLDVRKMLLVVAASAPIPICDPRALRCPAIDVPRLEANVLPVLSLREAEVEPNVEAN